jgi:hypothetical protein
MHIVTVTLFCFAFITGLVGFSDTPANASHDTPPTFHDPVPLEGYAWSSNIGWISFEGANYGVEITSGTGFLDGYAWSEHIGWIQFADISGCPNGTCAASVDFDTNEFSGWARALANGNGWDGWISLSGFATDVDTSPYRVEATNSGGFTLDSYAWGSDVVGWVNFSQTFFTPPCAAATSCTTDYLGTEDTDMWCQTDAPVACTGTMICTDANPVCADVTIDGDLTVVPPLVRTEQTATMSWSITNPASVDSCRVESNGGGSWANSPSESSPLTFNTNIFTLYCVPAGGGPEIEVDSEEVKKLPNVYEI